MSSLISSPWSRRKILICPIFLLIFLPATRRSYVAEHLGFSWVRLWTKASRGNLDRDMIIHRFTDLFTLTTPDAAFSCHDHALCIKVH